jgi:ribosomal protein L37AE/L43A
MTTTCAKCGEMLIAPDSSEFVSERLVVNLWSCTKCGDRFETKACADAAPKMPSRRNKNALLEKLQSRLVIPLRRRQL